MDLDLILDAVAYQLRTVPHVHQVESKMGGAKRWVTDPRPKLTHVEVDLVSTAPEEWGIGGEERLVYSVAIDAYQVYSYSNPDSTASWRTMLNAVVNHFREHKSLGGIGLVVDTSTPRIVTNTFRPINGTGAQAEIAAMGEDLVHYARIQIVVTQYISYSTT